MESRSRRRCLGRKISAATETRTLLINNAFLINVVSYGDINTHNKRTDLFIFYVKIFHHSCFVLCLSFAFIF